MDVLLVQWSCPWSCLVLVMSHCWTVSAPATLAWDCTNSVVRLGGIHKWLTFKFSMFASPDGKLLVVSNQFLSSPKKNKVMDPLGQAAQRLPALLQLLHEDNETKRFDVWAIWSHLEDILCFFNYEQASSSYAFSYTFLILPTSTNLNICFLMLFFGAWQCLAIFQNQELDAEIFLALRPQRLAESPLTGYFRTAPVPKMSSTGRGSGRQPGHLIFFSVWALVSIFAIKKTCVMLLLMFFFL